MDLEITVQPGPPWARAWLVLTGWWRPEPRPATEVEAALLRDCAALRRQLDRAAADIADLLRQRDLAEIDRDLERRRLKVEAEALQAEADLLAGVVERDRRRVEAEAAHWARQEELARTPPRRADY